MLAPLSRTHAQLLIRTASALVGDGDQVGICARRRLRSERVDGGGQYSVRLWRCGASAHVYYHAGRHDHVICIVCLSTTSRYSLVRPLSNCNQEISRLQTIILKHKRFRAKVLHLHREASIDSTASTLSNRICDRTTRLVIIVIYHFRKLWPYLNALLDRRFPAARLSSRWSQTARQADCSPTHGYLV